MSPRRLLLPPIVAAVVIAVSAVGRPAMGTDVQDLDILGLRLGMDEQAARAAAEQAGLAVVELERGMSFEQAVLFHLGGRIMLGDMRDIGRIAFADDEVVVRAFFVPMPDGPLVHSLFRDVRREDTTAEDVRAEIVAVYGEPDAKIADVDTWADPADLLPHPFEPDEFMLRPYAARMELHMRPTIAGRGIIIGQLILRDPAIERQAQDAVERAVADRPLVEPPSGDG